MVREFPEAQLKRVLKSMDDVGIVQHSKGAVPSKEEGDNPYPYSIDDASRALIVLSRYSSRFDDDRKHEVLLDFIKRGEMEEGRFCNYQDISGKRVEGVELSDDSFGRVVWGLAEFLHSDFPDYEKREVKHDLDEYIEEGIGRILGSDFVHPKALTLIGLSKYLDVDENLKVRKHILDLTKDLKRDYEANSQNGWDWFSHKLIYCNARLPQAMFEGVRALGGYPYGLEVAEESLNFLAGVSFDDKGKFNAIGNKGNKGGEGWYSREQFFKGEEPPRYDQQPVEAGCMVEAFNVAYRATGNEEYKSFAEKTFDWYNGVNIERVRLIGEEGGIYDAITREDVNTNQGAESVVTYLMAHSSFLLF